ncbi:MULTISPECIES: helix-turn-helix domain-containing protein [Tenebrionibacter/Tenebrionicola group]|jgi:AraC-like DNA-binding protein|uniref:Helix-turn-helix transcriptional regulator n=2 Tax=Tenebrionibacter/Tenebrionicola group TaxID=2969848 RepID=A0A8K0V1S5_9ENTR|nr:MULTISPECIES: AraC family transcriptional regulator [Tenebrionibacter/Tenebrionicola group]MBK4715417.1 helix-turn-helix transcriptional regulator [Tenebrionibacter intestinalis]MBV4413957.1 helix-turn-helix transcriptional regulator [Tenebrionicola larvae]MBV5096085.1 helix-turn-helix transcriptional regulator [Tenebrionicola larvae]
MNGKTVFLDVKNETTYNIPLVLDESVISSGIALISLWHTRADDRYHVIWPRDKKKPLIANSWVAIYTVQGGGKIILKEGSVITLNGNCAIFLKPTEIASYYCDGLLWEQYWMEFVPTGFMEIPLSQPVVIYNGAQFNQELKQVEQLIQSALPVENNLAVASLTRMIYQWICLIARNGTRERRLIRLESLLSALHADLRKRWTVREMAQWMQCSEQYLRRLFLRHTGKTPKEYHLDARLTLAQSLLRQERHGVSQVADMLNFFDTFHFSKAFKQKFGYAPTALKASSPPEG